MPSTKQRAFNPLVGQLRAFKNGKPELCVLLHRQQGLCQMTAVDLWVHENAAKERGPESPAVSPTRILLVWILKTTLSRMG